MKPQLQDGAGPTAMQLDAYVDVERLAEAMSELDKYIEAARAQLFEIRKKKAGDSCERSSEPQEGMMFANVHRASF